METLKKATVVCCLFLTGIITFGCNSNNILQPENEDKNAILTEAEVQKIAIQHNEAMSKVFTALKAANASQIHSFSKMKTVINSALNSYYIREFDKKSKIATANKYSSKAISKLGSPAKLYSNNSSKSLSPIEKTISKYKEHFSDSQAKLLMKIKKVLDNSASDVKRATDKLSAIQSLAKEKMERKEAQVILVAAEVGKASVKYWNKNFEKWKNVLSATESHQSLRIAADWSWSDLAGSDVAGAAGAAAMTAVVNVVPGGGQVAYGAAIAGGAVGGSVTYAVYQGWQAVFGDKVNL